MKTAVFAAMAVLGLAAPVLAQGLPAGFGAPAYGSQAFPNRQYHDHTVFAEMFAPARHDQPRHVRTAAHASTRAKNS